MATSKIPPFLPKTTPKYLLPIIQALLEWIVLASLLLNSLFSHLISKFASFSGLTPPCLLCSRLLPSDYADLFCDSHASELSSLSFCSKHRRLGEVSRMCVDCSGDHRLALLSLARSEREGREVRCSCCGVALESGFYSLEDSRIKPGRKGGIFDEEVRVLEREVEEVEVEVEDCRVYGSGVVDDVSLEVIGFIGGFGYVCEDRLIPMELIDSATLEDRVSCKVSEEKVVRERKGEVMDPLLDSITNVGDDERLVSVDLSGCGNEELKYLPDNGIMVEEKVVVEDKEKGDTHVVNDTTASQGNSRTYDEANTAVSVGSEISAIEQIDRRQDPVPPVLAKLDCSAVMSGETEDKENGSTSLADSNTNDEVNCEVVCNEIEGKQQEDNMELDVEGLSEAPIRSELKDTKQPDSSQSHNTILPVVDQHDGSTEICDNLDKCNTSKDVAVVEVEASEVDRKADEETTSVSARSEIYDQQQTGDCQREEPPASPSQCSGSTKFYNETEDKDQIELTEGRGHAMDRRPSFSAEYNEMGEDRAPDTPNSVDGSYCFQKRFNFDKRETGTESVDGSVTSEIDINELSTVEQFKAAYKAERRALNALYAELEEERNASTIAANQTMAMITRLQEEKAAMQMEALQYQRMMEEQAEYDHEALNILNDLMEKKEMEKQELERELEVYSRKVLLYEVRERRMQNTKGNGASSSNDDSDEHEGEDDSDVSNQRNSKIFVLKSAARDCDGKVCKTLDESLDDLEEERISILEQLKVLEERLFAVDVHEELDGEDGHEENGNLAKSNGHMPGEDEDSNNETNGFSNGVSGEKHIDVKPRSGRHAPSKRKSLLPLFDGASVENGLTDVSEPVFGINSDRKKHDITEEMDHLHERLQALEHDKEFLKHSIRSLKKGDEGMDLLQEILQHLRDLRNVELRIEDMDHDHASCFT